jgi:hypothetical protein
LNVRMVPTKQNARKRNRVNNSVDESSPERPVMKSVHPDGLFAISLPR